MAIKIDFASTRSEARKLIDIAEQCTTIKTTVLREKDLVPEYWYGESGKSMMELMQVWSNDLGDIVNDMQNLSNTIVSIANEMEEKEKERARKIAAATAAAAVAQTQAQSLNWSKGGMSSAFSSSQSFISEATQTAGLTHTKMDLNPIAKKMQSEIAKAEAKNAVEKVADAVKDTSVGKLVSSLSNLGKSIGSKLLKWG